MHKAFIPGLLLAAGLSLGALAQEVSKGQPAQMVKCTWQGNWGIKGNAKVANLTWTGFAFTAPNGGWLVYANGKDSAGPSRLRGGCMKGSCDVQQKYISGRVKNQLYYYKLNYKLSPLNKGSRTINFTGTWGADMVQPTHRGTAKINGQCRLDKVTIAGLPKLLGWDDSNY